LFSNSLGRALARRPSPHLHSVVADHWVRSKQGPCLERHRRRRRFVDLSTGLRVRYLEWSPGNEDTIILLHGMGKTAEMYSTLGSQLSARGYAVYAPEFRGHGGTEWPSSATQCTVKQLSQDVKAFIIAKDLYVRPVAIVGFGMGGAVGMFLAASEPSLVGATISLDFALPHYLCDYNAFLSDLLAQSEEENIDNKRIMMSSDLLPWWSLSPGMHGTRFASLADLAAFLASPLANLGPVVVEKLQRAQESAVEAVEAGKAVEAAVAEQRKILDGLARPLEGAVQDAFALVEGDDYDAEQAIIGTCEYGYGENQDENGIKLKMNPKFFFTFPIKEFVDTVRNLRSHFLLVYGCKSGMVGKQDAKMFTEMLRHKAASVTEVGIPGAGHHVVMDAPRDTLDALNTFLDGPAIHCFNVESVRRPENLGLRPLPEYATVEEARKALGPRSIPTAARIESALEQLRIEQGRRPDSDSDDGDEGETSSRYATALSKEPLDYFGFVG
jgi:pimeloyl-ACP methyl ester carboxylesterase